MILERLRPRRWLTRNTGRRLIWAAALLAAAITVNVIGIRMVGNLDNWQRWMADHAGYFFAWRLLLYAGTAYGWWRMHRRLRQREPDGAAHRRLVRVEIAAGLALVALEASLLWP